MIDIHTHILPFLDDGAKDWEASLQMARLAASQGVKAVVCTPHWLPGLYNITRREILRAVADLRSRLEEERIALQVMPGCEILAEPLAIELLEQGELPTLGEGGRYVLVELPHHIDPGRMADFFWALQARDYAPIVAHPERNPGLMANPQPLLEWVRHGVLVQVTSSSLLGKFGHKAQRLTDQLIAKRLAHVLATDAHGPHAHRPALIEGRRALEDRWGEELAWRMVREVPRAILQGVEVELEEPQPWEEKKGLLGRLFSRNER